MDSIEGFAEYDLWEHGEESPVSREQIAECVVIATWRRHPF
ncbi:hypothetical protein [Paenibacillus albidus]|nr:hypothetical protein [Paenibacillus albidus]